MGNLKKKIILIEVEKRLVVARGWGRGGETGVKAVQRYKLLVLR